MGAYIIRRSLLAVPTVILISMAAFASIRFVPGDVLDVLASERGISGDTTAIKERLGINDPIHVQYWNWLTDIVRGNGGESLLTGEPALPTIADRVS